MVDVRNHPKIEAEIRRSAGTVERADDWFQTFTGREFHILRPRVDDIVIEDIAHALAMQCRYNGHCLEFYSVAEHSVRVAMTLETLVPSDRGLHRWGLLHDAAEAYMGDMVRPLKREMPAYREAEERLMRVIAERFGLDWPAPPDVAAMDNCLLATEQRDLMSPPPKPWASAEDMIPLEEKIQPLDPREAKLAFLAQYHRLFVL